MPVKSYLVFPLKGKQSELNQSLSELPWCDVSIAENKELLVLVTDTENETEEEQCLQQLKKIEFLEHMTLVSGFEENKN